MLMSAVQVSDIKGYANIFYPDDDAMIGTILQAARVFISSYTGLPLTTATVDTNVIQKAITGKYTDATVTLNGLTITVTSPSSTIGYDIPWLKSQVQNAVNVPIIGGSSTANEKTVTLTIDTCDNHEDLTIALFVLCNEMYDNRDFTVDANKVNFVIKSILDNHAVNLL